MAENEAQQGFKLSIRMAGHQYPMQYFVKTKEHLYRFFNLMVDPPPRGFIAIRESPKTSKFKSVQLSSITEFSAEEWDGDW